MPIVHIHAPLEKPPAGLLESMCDKVAAHLQLPEGYMWALWHEAKAGTFFRANWTHGSAASGPIVYVYCKDTYTQPQVEGMLEIIRDELVAALGCKRYDVFVAAQRVHPGEVANRDVIWKE